MNNLKLKIVAVLLVLVGAVWFIASARPNKTATTNQQAQVSGSLQPTQSTPTSTTADNSIPVQTNNAISQPISNALTRVTKKTFGLYVSPTHSPVSPEKFTGYHTGVDFETTPDEQNIDVPIYALCEGKLLLKKYATGYGGVAVQSCKINNADVTIIYGHLRLSSISPSQGATLKSGQQIAVLGKGYSTETDGERKHLHLGIHKGMAINILGYVQKQSDLSNWIDALRFLK